MASLTTIKPHIYTQTWTFTIPEISIILVSCSFPVSYNQHQKVHQSKYFKPIAIFFSPVPVVVGLVHFNKELHSPSMFQVNESWRRISHLLFHLHKFFCSFFQLAFAMRTNETFTYFSQNQLRTKFWI